MVQQARVVCIHEAGHAVVSVLLGVPVMAVATLGVASGGTRHEGSSFEGCNPDVRIKVALAGGLAEEAILGGRSEGGTEHDDKVIAYLLAKAEPDKERREALKDRLTAEVRLTLKDPDILTTLRAVAQYLERLGYLTGVHLERIVRDRGKSHILPDP